MYGIVLMAAMTGGVESPMFFRRGCNCACTASCAKVACGGCYSDCGSCKRVRARRVKCSGCYTSCHSCHHYSSCHCVVVHAAPACHGCAVPAPVVHPAPVQGGTIIETKKPEASAAAPARLFVNLPADAKLTIDGEVTTSTSEERIFVSPELAPGKSYSYNLKAEFVRDGKAVVVSKDVKVAAGADIQVSLFETTAVASR